ncbi:MAG: TOBE domain-containing protein, partial [bacterium]|nr:TOBE domain-containing protein [bacterium]
LETTIIYVTHDQTEAMTLGTRIVVMKDGVVQQVDSPQNLYDKPGNKFVAGFIGAPQMNLIDATVGKAGSDVTLTFGGTNTITLPADKAKVLESKGYVGKTVVLGIRPEDLHDDAEIVAKNAKSCLTAKIRVYEMLGAEVYLYFDVDDTNFIARVNPATPARPGDTVKFAMDLSKLHVFDKETEKVIVN